MSFELLNTAVTSVHHTENTNCAQYVLFLRPMHPTKDERYEEIEVCQCK